MEESDIQRIVDGLSRSIEDRVNEAVYEQSKLKDVEVSALHREINKKLTDLGVSFETVKETLSDHDVVIEEVREILATTGIFKKTIIWVVFSIPALAAAIEGLKYLYHLFRN